MAPDPARSRQDSQVRVTARLSPNGGAQVQFKDRDRHDGLIADISRDDRGLGLLTVINEGPKGFSSVAQVKLGLIDPSIVGPLQTWNESFNTIKVCTGQGEHDAILLDDNYKVYLDGSLQKL